jgi:hypothetical protein
VCFRVCGCICVFVYSLSLCIYIYFLYLHSILRTIFTIQSSSIRFSGLLFCLFPSPYVLSYLYYIYWFLYEGLILLILIILLSLLPFDYSSLVIFYCIYIICYFPELRVLPYLMASHSSLSLRVYNNPGTSYFLLASSLLFKFDSSQH